MKLYPQILICFSISTSAQQQNRVIIDSQARQPVPWATIKGLHTNWGTIADARGNFRYADRAGDTLLISAVGYRDTLLPGEHLPDSINLTREIRQEPELVLHIKKRVATVWLGNGAAWRDKKISCNYTPGKKTNCLPWGPSTGAAFAERMDLPDSTAGYKLKTILLAAGIHGCWQPIFVQVYEPAIGEASPGKMIFQKYIAEEPPGCRQGKCSIDISAGNLYLSGIAHFWVGLAWDNNDPGTHCVTTLSLLKLPFTNTFTRNLQTPDYTWSLFDTKETGSLHFQTLFAAALDQYTR